MRTIAEWQILAQAAAADEQCLVLGELMRLDLVRSGLSVANKPCHDQLLRCAYSSSASSSACVAGAVVTDSLGSSISGESGWVVEPGSASVFGTYGCSRLRTIVIDSITSSCSIFRTTSRP